MSRHGLTNCLKKALKFVLVVVLALVRPGLFYARKKQSPSEEGPAYITERLRSHKVTTYASDLPLRCLIHRIQAKAITGLGTS